MKAGTTSVHRVLSAHPQIFMSRVKEPKYFAFQEQTGELSGPSDPDNNRYWVDLDRYSSLFAKRGESEYAGESSAIYLYRQETARNIANAVPSARIIMILRNPIDRAYSHFNFSRLRGLEPETSFDRALDLEESRVSNNWGSAWRYRTMGFYSRQVARYLNHFPQQNVFVGLFDELKKNPSAFYDAVFDFLGVPSDVELEQAIVLNRSMDVRFSRFEGIVNSSRRIIPNRYKQMVWRSYPWRVLRNLLRPIRRMNLKPVLPMQSETRGRLCAEFEDDIKKLEQEIGKDLGCWLDE
jgi:hypothetical protein